MFSAYKQEANIEKKYSFQFFMLHFCFVLYVCIGSSSLRVYGVAPWRGSVGNIILLHTRHTSATLH
jgi:hypothetical protein